MRCPIEKSNVRLILEVTKSKTVEDRPYDNVSIEGIWIKDDQCRFKEIDRKSEEGWMSRLIDKEELLLKDEVSGHKSVHMTLQGKMETVIRV